MEHEIRARWLRFHLCLQLGHKWSPVIHPCLLPRPVSKPFFPLPFLDPLASDFSGAMASLPDVFGSNHVTGAIFRLPCCYHSQEVRRRTFLWLLPLWRLLCFPLRDSSKGQASSCCHGLSANVVGGIGAGFELRGGDTLSYSCVKGTLNSSINACIDNALNRHAAGGPLRI